MLRNQSQETRSQGSKIKEVDLKDSESRKQISRNQSQGSRSQGTKVKEADLAEPKQQISRNQSQRSRPQGTKVKAADLEELKSRKQVGTIMTSEARVSTCERVRTRVRRIVRTRAAARREQAYTDPR
eukprot:287830-Pleurochrysis_carterae.AAC.1